MWMIAALSPKFFALEWMRASYRNRIAWVCAEIDTIVVQFDRVSGMAEKAKQQIYKALTNLRLAVVAVMDSNQPLDVLDRALANLKDLIRREIAQGPANADILATIESMLERRRAHARAVWELCNPEL